jgi:hypothetical protein
MGNGSRYMNVLRGYERAVGLEGCAELVRVDAYEK